MAGHSKWANIKHRKARQDALKGKAWSKCSRAIIVAAKNGGGDPAANLTLRYAIEEAKAANMPKDTIEKAIKKGAGELDGEHYEEIRYEGYGPSGVAIIVDCLTDKVTRTAPDLRKIFEKHGGNLAKPGAVAFGFSPKGIILIETSKVDEEQLMEVSLEAGAEDIVEAGGAWEVTTAPSDMLSVKEAIEAGLRLTADSAEVTMIPASTVACDEQTAAKVLRLVDALDEYDDVQKVYHNAEIDDEVMARIG